MRPKSLPAKIVVGAKAEDIRAFDASYSGATSAGPFSVVMSLVALWAVIKLAAEAGTSSKTSYGSTVDAADVPRLIKKDNESVDTINQRQAGTQLAGHTSRPPRWVLCMAKLARRKG